MSHKITKRLYCMNRLTYCTVQLDTNNFAVYNPTTYTFISNQMFLNFRSLFLSSMFFSLEREDFASLPNATVPDLK